MDQLLDFVKETIPGVSSTQMQLLQNKFEEAGVTEIESLQFLQPNELNDILKLVPARKLLQAAKNSLNRTDLMDSPEIPQSATQNRRNSTGTSDSDSLLDELDPFWSEKFKIPWHLLPISFLDACKTKQRPTEEMRRAAVRTLSFSIQQYCKKPTSSDVDKIAARMVSKYPESLGDMVMGKMLDSGYCSLKKNILDRMHNMNRCSQESSSSSENEIITTTVPSCKQYGCITWSEDMDDETEQLLIKKMKYMQDESFKTETCLSVIEEYMKETYPLQRKIINKTSSEDVAGHFPFLFKLRYLEIHFKRLTGFDLSNYLAADKKKLSVIHYLRSIKNPSLRKAIAEMDSHVKETNHHLKLVAFVKLLMSYFKEDKVIEFYQPCVNTKQVEEVKRQYGAPIIAVIGDLYSPLFFHVVFEGKIRATVKTIDDAVMLMFGLYYVFNLEYHPQAAQTLEFIQRVLIGINPERGSKKPKRCTKNGVISSKLVTLASVISDEGELQ